MIHLYAANDTAWQGELVRLREFDRKIRALTKREQEVLACLYRGCTSKEAAEHLDISPRTVEVHRRRIMLKFQGQTLATLSALLGKVELMYTLHKSDWLAMADYQHRTRSGSRNAASSAV